MKLKVAVTTVNSKKTRQYRLSLIAKISRWERWLLAGVLTLLLSGDALNITALLNLLR